MAILIEPIITEKMTAEGEKLGKYAFVVNRNSNKLQIKDAVEAAYNVKVVAVNTTIHPGKSKTKYTKSGMVEGRVGTYKKAVVTLNEGETIDFYSNI